MFLSEIKKKKIKDFAHGYLPLFINPVTVAVSPLL